MRLAPATPLRTTVVLLGTTAAVLALPLLVIAAKGEASAALITMNSANTERRLLVAEAARPWAPAPDSAISPVEAGEAFHALRSDTAPPAPGLRTDVPAVVAPWVVAPYPKGLFPGIDARDGDGPDHRRLLAAVAAGTTPEQRSWLAALAAAPAWAAWDRLATAPQVDFVSGRFALPFADTAQYQTLPMPKWAQTKGYAYASVARAAHHLAEGDRAGAEAALRGTLGAGYALVDDGNSIVDELIGMSIIAAGREALQQLWELTDDARADSLRARHDSLTGAAEGPDAPAVATRGLEIERAGLARLAVCTSVGGVLRGHDDTAEREFSLRRRALARTPGEQALFDLIERAPTSMTAAMLQPVDDAELWHQRLLVRIAGVTGALLRNPRLQACTSLALQAG
jgi:hypothetical protein